MSAHFAEAQRQTEKPVMSGTYLLQQSREALREQIQTQVREHVAAAQAAGQTDGPQAQRVVVVQSPPQSGRTTTTIQVPPNFARDMIPPQVVDLGIAYAIMIAFIVVSWPIARAFARRIDRTRTQPQVSPDLAAQISRLTSAVDAIAIEVERISEGQRFTTRLLTENQQAPRIEGS